MPVTPEIAQCMVGLATVLQHHSDEPHVIEPLIESALLLVRDGEVAYPKDFARFSRANRAFLDRRLKSARRVRPRG